MQVIGHPSTHSIHTTHHILIFYFIFFSSILYVFIRPLSTFILNMCYMSRITLPVWLFEWKLASNPLTMDPYEWCSLFFFTRNRSISLCLCSGVNFISCRSLFGHHTISMFIDIRIYPLFTIKWWLFPLCSCFCCCCCCCYFHIFVFYVSSR